MGRLQNQSLNRRSFRVTSNLDGALRMLRRRNPLGTYSIDAICINQDDEAEKSMEVRRIRHIFMAARGVIVWLGPAADGSDIALIKLADFGAKYKEALQKSPLDLDEDFYYLNNVAEEVRETTVVGTVRHLFAHTDFSDDDSADIPLTGFKALYRRPWWRRMWILQEVSMANRVAFVCGDCEVPGDSLFQAIDVLDGFMSSRTATDKVVAGEAFRPEELFALLYGMSNQPRTVYHIRMELYNYQNVDFPRIESERLRLRHPWANRGGQHSR